MVERRSPKPKVLSSSLRWVAAFNIDTKGGSHISINKKAEQLGMNPSTASHRLVKDILYKLIQEKGELCYRCNNPMTRDTFSIEHKINLIQVSYRFRQLLKVYLWSLKIFKF